MTNNQDFKEVQKIILKAQELISKQNLKRLPYLQQCYIRDLLDIQSKILYNNILPKAEGKQGNKLAFIITNINFILGAKQ